MKLKPVLVSILLGLIVPWILFSLLESDSEIENVPQNEATESSENTELTLISVLREDDSVLRMDMEQYLLGVLLGEMPSDFELEALKSQAVAARTFAVKSLRTGHKHTQADVCVNSGCCQSYYDPVEYVANGGSPATVKRFQNAVNDTCGQVLLYNGELIEATYFSCSGGRTEDAVAVWGTDVPYLIALDSPGEEGATNYTDTVIFTAEEFQQRMDRKYPGLPGHWIGKISYTNGGGVDTIEINGETYSGTQIRQKLGINSTAFMISIVGNSIMVTTKGYGHRVGLSQYGADAMAAQGKTYEEILAYYYPKTQLDHMMNV